HDARPDQRPADLVLRREHLVAERLGVRVDVGPAPVLRALHAELGEALGDPELALARDGETEVLVVVGVAALVAQTPGGALAEHRDVRAVVGERLHLRDGALAVDDLALDVEPTVVSGLAAARVVAGRVVFPDLPLVGGAIAGDEAGRYVNDRGAGLLRDV